MKQKDRQAGSEWDLYRQDLMASTPVDENEDYAAQQARIKRLEADDEAWFKYYFPKYAFAEPADFHKRSTCRVMNNLEWYEVRAWSRELAKSTRTMMEVLKLTLTGKKRNVLLISNSADNAELLLEPYRANLDSNQRIIRDYGLQATIGNWTAKKFVTRKGASFRAIGAGQSPRGARNEEVRPDVILFDDVDTDEDCRNPDTIDKRWKWIERAVIGTRSISEPTLILFCGNIIAEHCCINEAIKVADKADIVNIRDENGRSTWPQKNTEEMIDRVLSKISYASAQGEYFNNPITEGKIFKELHYKKLRPLREYSFLVSYCDPSYKDSKKNDYKAVALIGKWKNEFHVIKAYCMQTTTAEMLRWHYEIMISLPENIPVYYFIEWPSIDDGLKKELETAGEHYGKVLPLRPDERDKPNKYYRIESLLEPLNRTEKLWFNIEIKASQHMVNMEAQFKALSPTSRAHDDGPDSVEGGVWIINNKVLKRAPIDTIPRNPQKNKYRIK